MIDLKKSNGIGQKWNWKKYDALSRDEPSKIGNLWNQEFFPLFSIRT